MHLCRTAWRKLVPMARASSAPLLRNAPLRPMSSSSVPGSSGDSMIYYLVVGVSVAGAGFYVYRTLHRDRARFADRASYLEEKQQQRTWPPQSGDEGEETVPAEVSKEALGAAPVEVVAVTAEAALREAAVEAVAITVEDDAGAAVEALDEVVAEAVKETVRECLEQNQSTATAAGPQEKEVAAKETVETSTVGEAEQEPAARTTVTSV